MAGKTLTRSDLSEAVYREIGLSRNESSELVESILERIADALVAGDNVKISDITLPSDAEPTITDRDFTIATIAGRTAKAETEEETEEVDPEAVETTAQGGDEDKG